MLFTENRYKMQYIARTNCDVAAVGALAIRDLWGSLSTISDLWGSLSTPVDKLPQRSLMSQTEYVTCQNIE